MEVTNEQTEETLRLTIADLGVAAWATSELYNFLLSGYNEEDYGEMTKEQVEESMNKLRSSFIKFDSLARALGEGAADENQNEEATP
jgi:hypothetical protein